MMVFIGLLLTLLPATDAGIPILQDDAFSSAFTTIEQFPSARQVSSFFLSPDSKQNLRRANELSSYWTHLVAMDIFELEVDPGRKEVVLVPEDDLVMHEPNFTVNLYKRNSAGEFVNKGNGLLDMTFLYSDDLNFRKNVLRLNSRGLLKYHNVDLADIQMSHLNKLMRDSSGKYITGDTRVNDHVGLAMITELFLRNHNRIADELRQDFPKWDDDKLFDEAKLKNIHQYQKVSLFDLPAAMGGGGCDYDGYNNATTDAGVYDTFIAIVGHSIFATASPSVPRMDQYYREVADRFVAPADIIASGNLLYDADDDSKDYLEEFLRGATFLAHGQTSTPSRYFINKGATDRVLKAEGKTINYDASAPFDGDSDLVAQAIVRMRDLGVLRGDTSTNAKQKGGVFKGRTTDYFQSSSRFSGLTDIYNSTKADVQLDLIVCIFGDDGETSSAASSKSVYNAYKKQMQLSSESDPAFFQNKNRYSEEGINEIWEFKLKNLVELNTGVSSSLNNAFFQADGQNNVMSEAVSSGLHNGEEMTWHDDHKKYQKFFQPDPWFGVSSSVVDDDYIEFLMEVKTTGWAAIGFAPSGGHGMLNTDLVRCLVKAEDDWAVEDMKANRIGGPSADTKLGGNNDLIENSTYAWEENGHTLCTFARKLDTNDTQDFPIRQGEYGGIYAYSYVGSDGGYHGPTRGFYSTTFWDIPEPIPEPEDPLPKIIAGIVITVTLAIATLGYYCYMRGKDGQEYNLEQAMTEDQQRRSDLKSAIKLQLFWLGLDFFDLGTDIASMIFAVLGNAGSFIQTMIFGAFVSISIVVSAKVVTSRTKQIYQSSKQLNGDANAKLIGDATYKDMVTLLKRTQSTRRSAAVHPVSPRKGSAEPNTETGSAPGVHPITRGSSSISVMTEEQEDAKFKKEILEYADAVTGLHLIKWLLILMMLEDIPSLSFNIYFIKSVWPNVEGMETPFVSLMVTVLSLGYKLTYLQKRNSLKKMKATRERNFHEIGISQEVIVGAVKAAHNKKKSLDGAFVF